MKTSTIGQALRSERQSRHISLERLAEQIHVKLSYLEALENDDFSLLPTAAYVRGYIRAYAQQLGVEPRPLLALLRRDYKETNKGVLVPREFIKSVRPRRLTWTPVTWIAISLMLFFGVVVSYLLIQWIRYTRPPELVITTPESRAVVNAETEVAGFTDSDAVVTINDQPVAIQPDGSFQTTIHFPVEGMGIISVTATDRRGKSAEELRTVTVQF